jgi:hypothetical protein
LAFFGFRQATLLTLLPSETLKIVRQKEPLLSCKLGGDDEEIRQDHLLRLAGDAEVATAQIECGPCETVITTWRNEMMRKTGFSLIL